MRTTNLIQSNVDVIRITNLKKGDLYKRITDSSYDNDRVVYGVVLDLLNTGEKTFIEAIEYKKSYNDVAATNVCHNGDKDISIFPCEISELEDYFKEAIRGLKRSVKKDKEELEKKEIALRKAIEFSTGELSKNITAVDFTVIPQVEYNKQKKEKEDKMKEIANQ